MRISTRGVPLRGRSGGPMAGIGAGRVGLGGRRRERFASARRVRDTTRQSASSRMWVIPSGISEARWVTRISGMGRRVSSDNASARDRRESASSPSKGSSRMSGPAVRMRVRAIRTFRNSPVERHPMPRSRMPSMPRRERIAVSDFGGRAPSGKITDRAGVTASRSPLKSRAASRRRSRSMSRRPSSNETRPTAPARLWGPCLLTRPRTAGTSPVNARTRVDFPDPLGPITAQCSPVRISQEVRGKRSRSLTRRVTASSVIRC